MRNRPSRAVGGGCRGGPWTKSQPHPTRPRFAFPALSPARVWGIERIVCTNTPSMHAQVPSSTPPASFPHATGSSITLARVVGREGVSRPVENHLSGPRPLAASMWRVGVLCACAHSVRACGGLCTRAYASRSTHSTHTARPHTVARGGGGAHKQGPRAVGEFGSACLGSHLATRPWPPRKLFSVFLPPACVHVAPKSPGSNTPSTGSPHAGGIAEHTCTLPWGQRWTGRLRQPTTPPSPSSPS